MNEQSSQFAKYFGLPTGIALIVTSIIGSGVYKKAAKMAVECESPEMILGAWLLAGLVTLMGVLTLAEIATLLPVSGGPFAYLKEIYGEETAFAYGWASFACIQTASTAAIAYVFAESLVAFAPDLKDYLSVQSLFGLVHLPDYGEQLATYSLFGLLKPFENFGVKLIAVGLIAFFTLINCRGVHVGGGVGNVITVIVLVSIVLTTLVSFLSTSGSLQNLTQESSTYPPAKLDESFGFIRVLFVTMLASFWAYEGWINVGFVGDEIHEPQKNIPRILIFGVLIICSLYLMVNAAYLYVLPMDDLIEIGKQENGVVAVEVIRKVVGPWGAHAMSLLIVITTMGCTNSTILTSSRIYNAMAKEGLFFKSVAKIDPVRKVPVRSLLLFGVWSSMLVFSGSFDQLTDMLVFAQFVFYALVVAGVFVLRVRMPNAHRSYKVLGYPVVPAVFILFCIVLIGNTLWEKPRDAGIGIFLILLGAPLYLYLKKPKD